LNMAPPSTLMACPVISSASDDAKKTTSLPIECLSLVLWTTNLIDVSLAPRSVVCTSGTNAARE